VLDDPARCNRVRSHSRFSGAIAEMDAARSIPGGENGANSEKGRGSRTLEFFCERNICPD